MSESFFQEMGLQAPDFNLGIGGGTQGAMTGMQLKGIEEIPLDEKPDCLLVDGDTNSTLAGALAAVKLHIPVAHVEAGLRSWNKKMPEEVNRVLTDRVSTFLFTPCAQANQNLDREGSADGVHFVGDIMHDAALHCREIAEREGFPILQRLGLEPGGFRLATVHRQENVDHPDRIKVIFDGLRQLATDMPLVLPIHPRLRNMLQGDGRYDDMRRGLTVIDPLVLRT